MSARLVEIIVPDAQIQQAGEIITRHCRRFWQEVVPDGREKYSCIVQQRYLERLLAELDEHFLECDGYSAIAVEIDALSPQLLENSETRIATSTDLPPPTRLESFFTRERISTNELYEDIEPSLSLKPNYLLTVILSALIAALGMRSGQTAVVIGAMVIAPMLGPTMALALAATVGNGKLGKRAATTLTVGLLIGFIFTMLLGAMITVDPTVPELLNRTIVQPADIALALACGAAGVLAFSQGASLALVGVMIAVALVPPLSASGLFFGSGQVELGFKAMFLLMTNLVCVNVAGIAMFLIQGLPPKDWRMTGGIFAVWSFILALFIGLVGGRIAFG
ncbi:TIGR00341 family protein [Parasphingorhabdus halotolerans]|uniref:TIGR00341 family protein n=1 Tax=Parasphingorhabdus halotolerans TaxID=2725558 RepID=A0A6H2DQ34_9SPHN|nr:TIGR00341 family protein [Parasphingorhabdus halotolerans]QJB70500.1 TIGR00341 family protein [Parasphingorhabdus halotolerans]